MVEYELFEFDTMLTVPDDILFQYDTMLMVTEDKLFEFDTMMMVPDMLMRWDEKRWYDMNKEWVSRLKWHKSCVCTYLIIQLYDSLDFILNI